MINSSKSVELTPQEAQIKKLKRSYYKLVLDKNSYIHDLSSPISQMREQVKNDYQKKIKHTESLLSNVTKQLEDHGLALIDGKWY